MPSLPRPPTTPGLRSPPAHPFVAEADAPKPPTPSRRARQLLQLAHQAVYRLPPAYPGFAATVVAGTDEWTVHGSVVVHCPHGAVFEADPHLDGPAPAAVTTVTTMILDLVSWQFPKRFDDLDGRHEAGFRPDLDQGGRRAIQLLGEPRRTIRWLDDRGVVATAYRRAGVAHTIEVRDRRVLDDGRWLPTSVQDTRRAEGTADVVHEHVDEFVEVDGSHLPLRRVASAHAPGDRGGALPVTIELSEHRRHPGPATG